MMSMIEVNSSWLTDRVTLVSRCLSIVDHSSIKRLSRKSICLAKRGFSPLNYRALLVDNDAAKVSYRKIPAREGPRRDPLHVLDDGWRVIHAMAAVA